MWSKRICWMGVLFICVAICGCTRTKVLKQNSSVEQVTFSLRKLTCEGCGARVLRLLKRHKGIQKATFDKHKVELQLAYHKDRISEAKVVKMVQDMGFVALKGAGKGAYLPPVKFDKDMDVKWLAKKGERVDLRAHLALKKVTVFDFYAVWCGPCKDVDHALYRLMKKYPNIALRKINIVDWNKPVVKQHMAKISRLPYLLIFDKKGQKVQVLVGRKLKEMKRTIIELATKK